jgi:glycosyltransferase involved in cell wall biosynthesis
VSAGLNLLVFNLAMDADHANSPPESRPAAGAVQREQHVRPASVARARPPRPSFYGTVPLLVARELRRFRPHAIVTQSPFETLCALPARAALRSRVKLITELHGDWRTAARLYGSTWRRLYAGLADRAAVLALRRSTRAVSGFTAGLAERATGRTSAAVFPTYFDIESFTREAPRPLPTRRAVAWIGVLERYKNPRPLADAWRLVAPRVPGARLVVVGRGRLQPIVDDLVREFPDRG